MSRKLLVPFQLPADPTLALEAATKQYVDNNALSLATGDARYVNVTGDTMSGPLATNVVNGTGTAGMLGINANWMPYSDGSNYYSANAHAFRSLDASQVWLNLYSTQIDASRRLNIWLAAGMGDYTLHTRQAPDATQNVLYQEGDGNLQYIGTNAAGYRFNWQSVPTDTGGRNLRLTMWDAGNVNPLDVIKFYKARIDIGTQLRLVHTGDISTEAHAFQIGATNAQNLSLDNRVVQSRANGTGVNLYLNYYGGPILIGTGGDKLVVTDTAVLTGVPLTVGSATESLIYMGGSQIHATNTYMTMGAVTKDTYMDGVSLWFRGAGYANILAMSASSATFYVPVNGTSLQLSSTLAAPGIVLTGTSPIVSNNLNGDLGVIRTPTYVVGKANYEFAYTFPESPIFIPDSDNGLFLASGFMTPSLVETSPNNSTWTTVPSAPAKTLFCVPGPNTFYPQTTKYLRITIDFGTTYVFPTLVALKGIGGNTGAQGRILLIEKLDASGGTVGVSAPTTYGPTDNMLFQESPLILHAISAYDGGTQKLRITIEFTTWVAGNQVNWRSLNIYACRPYYSAQGRYPFSWNENKTVTFQSNAVGGSALIAKQYAGQTTPILRIVNSADADFASFDSIGRLTLGGSTTTQLPISLNIIATQHATSRRSGLALGDWQIVQDKNGDGTKDFGLWCGVGSYPFTISADGKTIRIGDYLAGSVIYLGHVSDAKVVIGNDAAFKDVGQAHSIGLISETDSAQGRLYLGNKAFAHGSSTSLLLSSATGSNIFVDGDAHYFRTGSGALNKMTIDGGGVCTITYGDLRLTANGPRIVSDNSYINFIANTNMYFDIAYSGAHCYFRRVGDYAALMTLDSDGTMYTNNIYSLNINAGSSTITCGVLNCTSVLQMNNGQSIRLIPGDPNHSLQYNGATPTGSGEANNGPELRGYNSVWLHTVGPNYNFFLASSGHVHINSGRQYSFLSSRRLKKDIEPISIQDCLDQVLRWRPVTFKWKENDVYGEGFIAEEMDEVSPWHVTRDGPGAEEPGKINGIGYATLTIQLAGAIQVLNNRIEELEKKVA